MHKLISVTPCFVFCTFIVIGCGKSGGVSQSTDGGLAYHQSADRSEASLKKYSESIHRPVGPPRVDTGEVDSDGNPITVSCTTCHETRPPNPATNSTASLNEFHQGLPFAHGTIACLSCHNRDDYDSLCLSNGTRVEYSDVMTLCAQCHGRQMIDYEHGAHGGMNGYWDLNRGPRTRNNCIDCHDPHSPKFPQMVPTFKPIDRFLNDSHDASKAAHE